MQFELTPVQDIASYRAIKSLLLRWRPDILLAYTAKPVIYGGLAAQSVDSVRFFPMITGLGYAFTEGTGLHRRTIRAVVQRLYRQALKCAETVIFQNPDDQALFRALGLVPERIGAARVYGSGVDLQAFPRQPLPSTPVFLMLSRLVADKGVREYLEAARMVKQRIPNAVFRLAGGLDSNPAGITQPEVQAWVDAGVIEYLGNWARAQSALAGCRYYVLPSYREGTPRSILEAMATGRPVITTDAPGCRETVIHGQNGLLVPPRNAVALAEAMTHMLEMSESAIQDMAEGSLALAREKFDVHKVNGSLLAIMKLEAASVSY